MPWWGSLEVKWFNPLLFNTSKEFQDTTSGPLMSRHRSCRMCHGCKTSVPLSGLLVLDKQHPQISLLPTLPIDWKQALEILGAPGQPSCHLNRSNLSIVKGVATKLDPEMDLHMLPNAPLSRGTNNPNLQLAFNWMATLPTLPSPLLWAQALRDPIGICDGNSIKEVLKIEIIQEVLQKFQRISMILVWTW